MTASQTGIAGVLGEVGDRDALTATPPADEHVTILEAGRAQRNYWSDLWRFRELFTILAWRDLTLRYKQTVIGVAWGIIRPLATVAVFTVVFSRVARLQSDGMVPYALMVFAGMLPWTLLSNILGQASGSLLNGANLIGKIYFPRLILPAAAVAVVLVDTGVSLLLLLAMMLWFGILPDWRIAFLPAFLALAVLAGFGPALWLAAINVKYRDFQYIVGFVLQFGLYLSPVGFSSTAIPAQWRLVYSLNPAVGVIDGFRWSLLRGSAPLYPPALLLSIAITAFMLWAGIAYFRKAENTFSDVI
jgi:lipopolysaccharide transport system permease protein